MAIAQPMTIAVIAFSRAALSGIMPPDDAAAMPSAKTRHSEQTGERRVERTQFALRRSGARSHELRS
jgi:hypothetical protein